MCGTLGTGIEIAQQIHELAGALLHRLVGLIGVAGSHGVEQPPGGPSELLAVLLFVHAVGALGQLQTGVITGYVGGLYRYKELAMKGMDARTGLTSPILHAIGDAGALRHAGYKTNVSRCGVLWKRPVQGKST